jgi:MSHA biogenesis protein MshO
MHPRHQQGFTLIELIAVIMVGAIMAGTLTVFLKPALDTYGDTRVRADLADQGDTALRRMLRDVRRSVPNSLRLPSDQCFELVPASTGGRYRMGPDVTNDNAAGCSPSATCTAWVDPTQTTSMFDTLSPLSVTPGIGDWIVINNQNGNDVYTGANRSPITNTVTAPPSSTQGYHRISMTAMQVPQAYNGGRFLVVSNTEQSVFYVCSGADGALNASGNGKGTLYRVVRSFTAAYPTTCPSVASGVVLATNIKSCSFVYDANQGATQQSGFMWMDIEMARNNESAHMAVGAHVVNVP